MDKIEVYRKIPTEKSNFGGGTGRPEDPFRAMPGADLREFAKEAFAKWAVKEEPIYLLNPGDQVFSVSFIKDINGFDVSFQNSDSKKNFTQEEITTAVWFSSIISQGLAELVSDK